MSCWGWVLESWIFLIVFLFVFLVLGSFPTRRSSDLYNGRELLDVILPSLAAQTYPRLTVTVLDNGSSDDSAKYVRQHWPDARVVALPENVGVAAALNRGLETVETELVALLNNDIELE